jgi:hypothetical protein
MSGPGAGAGKLARRSPRARGRARRSGLLAAADGPARPDMGACLGPADGAGAARDRHGLRDQRGLCLVAPGGLRAGGAGEGRRGVQPHEPGDRADLCRRDRRGKRLRRGPGSGPWPPRPSRPRPIASCGRTGRRGRNRRPARSCPPGTIHLPDWADGEWLKQLTAEQLVTVRTKRGFARLEWQKLRERNEALDCRVYARAAAWIARGGSLARGAVGRSGSPARGGEAGRPEAGPATPPSVPTRPMPRRRTVRSSYMR